MNEPDYTFWLGEDAEQFAETYEMPREPEVYVVDWRFDPAQADE